MDSAHLRGRPRSRRPQIPDRALRCRSAELSCPRRGLAPAWAPGWRQVWRLAARGGAEAAPGAVTADAAWAARPRRGGRSCPEGPRAASTVAELRHREWAHPARPASARVPAGRASDPGRPGPAILQGPGRPPASPLGPGAQSAGQGRRRPPARALRLPSCQGFHPTQSPRVAGLTV